jgi:nitrite reductase (NADH) large subunit
MAGLEANYPGSTAMNSLNYFGLDIATAGMVQEPDSDDSEVIVSKRNGYYQKLVLCNNVIVGMVFIGRIENAGIIYGLIREGFDVGSFKQSLLADDFGLVYLPDKLRRERLSGITDQVIPKMKPGLTEYK